MEYNVRHKGWERKFGLLSKLTITNLFLKLSTSQLSWAHLQE